MLPEDKKFNISQKGVSAVEEKNANMVAKFTFFV